VKGTIHAKHLIVTGRVEGIFKIAECLEIHGTGWVEGEVEVGSLVVDEGGTLQGSCTRRGATKAKEVEAHKVKVAEKGVEDRFAERPGLNNINGSTAPTFEPAFAKSFEQKKP
jgi:cytoskeletal protein CcmA (bactofilin family)